MEHWSIAQAASPRRTDSHGTAGLQGTHLRQASAWYTDLAQQETGRHAPGHAAVWPGSQLVFRLEGLAADMAPSLFAQALQRALRVEVGAVLRLLAAMVLGSGAVAVGAAVVEKAWAAPPFKLGIERFDQRCYVGRFAAMLTACDPWTLLASKDRIRRAVQQLEWWSANNGDVDDDVAKLWSARKLKEAAVHPDLGTIVPRPFRMSGFVPYNGPITVATMISTSFPAIVFWNALNQAQIALVNYYNRNASSGSTATNDQLLASFLVATSSALTVSLGLAALVKTRYPPELADRVLRFAAFPTSNVATSLSCYIMRHPEIKNGIAVFDSNGRLVVQGARSRVAAWKAVRETIVSRVLLDVPGLLLPATITSLPCIANFQRKPGWALAVDTLTIMLCFGFGLPAANAAFPQTGAIRVSLLEPEFQQPVSSSHTNGLANECNSPDPAASEFLYYNKGL